MAKNVSHLIHLHSSGVTASQTPQLPSASALEYGELAINYKTDKETISLKNSDGDIVTFSSDKELIKVEKVISQSLNDLNTRISGTTSDLGELSALVETNVTNIETVSGEVASLNTSVGTLSTNLNTVSGKADANTANINTVSGNLTTVSGQVATVSGNVATVSGDVATIDRVFSAALNVLDTKIGSVSGDVSTMDYVIASALNALNERISALESDIEDILSTI